MTVTTTPPTSGLLIKIAASSDYFIDVPCENVGPDGVPTEPMNPIPNVTTFFESSPGVYQLEFWRPQGVVPMVFVTINDNLTQIQVPSSAMEPTCTCEEPTASIPTLSQWGLIIFGLLVLNLSLIHI